MKKKIVTLVLLFTVSASLSSCGKSDSNEVAKLTEQLEQLQSDYDSLQEEFENYKNNINSSFQDTAQETFSSSAADTNNQNSAKYEITDQRVIFHTDSVGTIWSQAIAEITNTGDRDLFLDIGSYDLFAPDGSIIHSSTYFQPSPQIIGPGETGYYYESATMDTGTPTENISITPRINASICKVKNYNMETSNTAIFDKEYGGIDIHGEVKNTTDVPQENICISAVLLNADGHSIGQVSTLLQGTLEPGASAGFELEPYSIPDNITSASVAEYKVFAYPNQYQF